MNTQDDNLNITADDLTDALAMMSGNPPDGELTPGQEAKAPHHDYKDHQDKTLVEMSAENNDAFAGDGNSDAEIAALHDKILGGAGKALTTAKDKKATQKQQILLADPISKAANTIENLTAEAALKMAVELVDGTEFSTFQLGGVFAKVNSSKYFLDYGHPDFKSWVEQAHGMKYRKAMYLISIYETLLGMALPWDKVKGLGWTKLKTMLNPNLNLLTAENVDEWVDKAKNMTVLQLESAVTANSKDQDGSATEQDAGKTVTTMTFKLHADQKELIREALEKAKATSGTTYDTVALEQVAMEFLGKPIAPPASKPVEGQVFMKMETGADVKSLAAMFKATGYELVLEAFGEAFPSITLDVLLAEDEPFN